MKPILSIVCTRWLPILLLALGLLVQVPTVRALELTIVDPPTDHIYATNDTRPIVLHISNDEAQTFKGDLAIAVFDFDGPLPQSPATVNLNLAPGANRDWTLPFDTHKPGIYWIQIPGGKVDAKPNLISLARMDPVGQTPIAAADDFIFGVSSHATRYDRQTQQREAQAAARIGVKMIRGGMSWATLQPKTGVDKTEDLESWWKLLYGLGMTSQDILWAPPRWASSAADDATYGIVWRSAPKLDVWRVYVHEMAQRGRQYVRFWEIWNEPDLHFFHGTADEYVALVEAASREIHAVDPHAVVMSGGFSGRPDNRKFIQEVLARAGSCFDASAWHQHGLPSAFEQHMDGFVADMRHQYMSGKPYLMNESGFSVSDNSIESQIAQCSAMFKKIAYAWSRGALGLVWYELRNNNHPGSLVENSFGMMTRDFQPKASYIAYNTLAGKLAAMRYVGKLDLGAGVTAFEFRKDDRVAVVHWAELAQAQSAQIVQLDAVDAATFTVMGRTLPLEKVDTSGRIVNIGMTPQITVWRGVDEHSEVKAEGPILTCHPMPLVKGQPLHVDVLVSNPTDTPATYDVTFASADLPNVAMKQVVTLTPQSTQQIDMTSSQVIAQNFAKPILATVTLYSAGHPVAALDIPLPSATVIPSATWSDVVDLNNAIQRVNLFGDDPHQIDHQWKGRTDLAATYRLRAAGDSLWIDVTVQDDEHEPNLKTGWLWKGDSIQLGFAPSLGNESFIELTIGGDARGHAMAQWGSGETSTGTYQIRRQGDQTFYRLVVPLSECHLTRLDMAKGIRVGVLINDCDQDVREGWLENAPGIGGSKSARQFPLYLFSQSDPH
jgi:hypothetical protein